MSKQFQSQGPQLHKVESSLIDAEAVLVAAESNSQWLTALVSTLQREVAWLTWGVGKPGA